MEKFCQFCGEKIIEKRLDKLKKRKYCRLQCQKEERKENPQYNAHLKKGKEVPCDNCGKKKYKKPSEIRDTNFCNHDCKAEYQNKNKDKLYSHYENKIDIECDECKIVFQIIPSRYGIAKFCSKECLGKSNGVRAKETLTNRIHLKCTNCDDDIYRKPSEVKDEYNYCSYECMGEHYSEIGRFSGENSPTWKGGDIDYYGSNWRSQRRKARERDNYTCQDCGITEEELGHELSVHHIKLFREFNGDWEKANELENLVSLCEYPCHRNRHKKN